jgi:NIPSNAP
MVRWSPIVELRQYTLHPGMRDVLIDLFEANLVESQEDAGMKIIGTFRDLDDPDKFVWLRGFDTMDSRARSLAQFYGGPVWQRHREDANRTMVDSDNVLLLRPARANDGFILQHERPAVGASDGRDRGLVEALVLELQTAQPIDAIDRLAQDIAASVAGAGGSPLASFVTEESENTYPALPVRDGETVYVCFIAYPDDAHERQRTALLGAVAGTPRLKSPPTVLRLQPTVRSLLQVRSRF